jgi:tetratricopeptide (TPR) repeat protein
MLRLWGRFPVLVIAVLSLLFATTTAQTAARQRIGDQIVASREVRPAKRSQHREKLESANAKHNLAVSYLREGERLNDAKLLEQAIVTFREALKGRTRARVPLGWASTQSELGIALVDLGKQQNNTARIEEGIAAFREALKEWTRKRTPLEWAIAHNNLGWALPELATRQPGWKRASRPIAKS